MKKIFFFLIIIAAAIFFLMDKGRPVDQVLSPSPATEEILPTASIGLPESEEAFLDLPPAAAVLSTSADEKDDIENHSEAEIKELAPPASSSAPIEEKSIILSVPFIAQAPLAHWEDARQQDGCEEAGALMAMAWARGTVDASQAAAEKEIIALADWEQETYGEHRDVYIDDVATRIFQDYFNYNKVTTEIVDSAEDLLTALKAGKLILAPTNGQALHNPNFKAPGPARHLLVIIGYDAKTDEFITNDPGTRRGAGYRYPSDILFKAIRAYPSGYHLPIVGIEKKVLLVEK
ncbi:MAG: C39 family peptidase [Patescibacteria group bacterium]|nr:C39 family peptidase [Patescibacteria group bacterium]